METLIIKPNNIMTSLQIAELTGKSHAHIMRDIRNMEPAWEKINESKFGLVDYVDSKGEKRPMYELTKTETLYIATKFNDEARAKLVLRWEELERNNKRQVPTNFKEALLLAAEQQEQLEQQQAKLYEQQHEILQLTSTVASIEKKVTYMDIIFACKSTVKVKTIAQDYGMSAIAFNELLHEHGIQYRCGDTWVLYAKYLPEGYVKDVPFHYVNKSGQESVHSNMQWTQKGRCFLYEFLKERGIFPLIESNKGN